MGEDVSSPDIIISFSDEKKKDFEIGKWPFGGLACCPFSKALYFFREEVGRSWKKLPTMALKAGFL